ncbi:MAG: N-acetyl-gamma-glutamyl-phosphate reductase [Candidatus Omnitrophica bacterium]|nr:N-acetyl-gamma-glutamyl-phosphate reductase [Candidatus Omnitrophota bacterium]
MDKVKVGVVGATGYAGEELIRILLNHPQVEINYLSAKIDKPTDIIEIFPQFKKKISLICEELDIEKLAKKSEVVFLATPHGYAHTIVPELRKRDKIVIDLSADFRLKDEKLYKKWYNFEHSNKKFLEDAVYGLPEVYREEIKKNKLIANPGCYPTGVILGSLPLVKNSFLKENTIIVDTKSGATGAGRTLKTDLLFNEVNETIRVYKINAHQHIPEIEQELSLIGNKDIKTIFVPHLLPLSRGILSCIYIKLNKKFSTKDLLEFYNSFYKNEPFVRVLKEGNLPQLKSVQFSNYCDIGISVDQESDLAIVISAIDNLGKGASGQAVQNLNIIMGWEETVGLK